MRNYGLEIDRPIEPTEIILDEREEVLASPDSYPVKVRLIQSRIKLSVIDVSALR